MAIDDTDSRIEFINESVKNVFDETVNIRVSSEKHFEELEKNSKGLDDSVKRFNEGLISTKQFVKECMDCLKEVRNIILDIKNTTKSHQLDKALGDRLVKAIEAHGSTISPDTLEDIKKVLSNYDVNNIKNSVRDEERGKDPVLKNTDNSKARAIYKDFLASVGIKVDSGIGRILTFMGALSDKEGKRNKGFVKDILEGIASSRLIGGAFKDMLKLLGLMAGSWIKSHADGPLGGWLAGGAYILISIIVPAVLKMLMNYGLEKLGGKLLGGVLGSSASGALGASKVASTVTGAVGEGITEGSKALHGAEEAAKLSQGLGGTLGKDGLIRGLGSRPLESVEKTAQALSQSTSKLSNLVQPLAKILDSPITKFVGKAAPVLGYGAAAYEGYKGVQDLGKGNAEGAFFRGTSAVTGAAAMASWGWALAAAPETFGASFLAPLLLTVASWYASWQAQQSENNYEHFISDNIAGSTFNGGSGNSASVSGGSSNLQVSGSNGSRKNPASELSLVKVLGTNTRLSTEGKRFIANQEGRYEYTYDDHGKWKNGRRVRFMPGDIREGTLTAGIGHTGKDVVPGGTYSNGKIESWFKSDLKLAKNRVDYSVRKFAPNLAVPQDIYDMMIDSSFQAGYSPLEVVGKKGLTGKPTPLMKALMAGNWNKARELMTNGSYGNKNRATRRKTFFKDANILPPPPTAETSQVEPPKEPEKKPEKKPEKTPEVKVEPIEAQKKSEDNKSTGTNLVNAINAAASVDIPGNDTTFKVLKDFNNISIFGGD